MELLLRLPEVCRRTGLSRSSLYRLVQAGKFEAPLKLTERSSAWRESAVQAFIQERIAAAGRPLGPSAPL